MNKVLGEYRALLGSRRNPVAGHAAVPDLLAWLSDTVPATQVEYSLRNFLNDRGRRVLPDLPLRLWRNHLDLVKHFNISAGVDVRLASAVSDAWLRILNLDGNEQQATQFLITTIAEMGGWELRDPFTFRGAPLGVIRYLASEQRSTKRVGRLATLFTIRSMSSSDADEHVRSIFELQDALTLDVRSLTVLVLLIAESNIADHFHEACTSIDDLVVFDESRIRELLLASTPRQTVVRILSGGLGVGAFNPYREDKPVRRAEMFFGRRREIRLIADNPDQDFAVIGGRKLGKSSLLIHASEYLRQQADYTVVEFDAATCTSSQQMIDKLATSVRGRETINIDSRGFVSLVRGHPRRVLFLIDEIDGLLDQAAASKNWRDFEALRALSQDEAAQTVFTGHRSLYKQWLSQRSPFFNFTRPLLLSTLDVRSATELVKTPMRRLDVTFADNSIVSELVTLSGQNPSLLQHMCRMVLTALSERDAHSRRITLKDVETVRTSGEYVQFVLRTYLESEDLDSLQRLIVLVLSQGEIDKAFSPSRLLEWLDLGERVVSPPVLRDSLFGLEIEGLIRRLTPYDAGFSDNPDEVLFKIMAPAFPRVLRQNQDVDDSISEIISELENDGVLT